MATKTTNHFIAIMMDRTNQHIIAVGKRASNSHTYSHAVFVSTPKAKIEAQLRASIKHYTEEGARYRKQAEQGDKVHHWSDGSYGYTTTVEQFLQWAEGCDKSAAEAQAKLDAGVVGTSYTAYTWTSRLDLAQKQFRSYTMQGLDAVIVEAQLVTPAEFRKLKNTK